MKKLLGSTMALAMFLSAGSANAELLKNLKLSGKIDLQGTAARNIRDFQTKNSDSLQNSGAPATQTGQDRIGDMQTRVMLSGDWDVLDDVHARVTIRKNDRTWGNSSQNLNAIQSAFEADEAFIKIDKLAGHLDTTLGRQFLGEEGDMVLYYGPKSNLYGMSVTAIDAARADFGGESWTGTAFTGKATGNASSLGTASANQQDVRGLILGCKGHENVSVKAHLYNQATHRADSGLGTPPSNGGNGSKNDNLFVAGVKAKATMGALFINGEFHKNFGEERQTDGNAAQSELGARKYTGYAFRLNGGAKIDMSDVGMLTAWAEYAYGSGDRDNRTNKDYGFTAIASDYRPGAIYGRFASNATTVQLGNFLAGTAITGDGLAANNGMNNRVIKGAGVKFTPSSLNKLTVGVSVWDYWFQHGGRKDSNINQTGSGNRHIGSEAGLDATWQHSENVSVKLGAGQFQPGGYIKNAIASNATNGIQVRPAYLVSSDFSVKF